MKKSSSGSKPSAMSSKSRSSRSAGRPIGDRLARVPFGLVIVAMVFPTAAAWLYFVRLDGSEWARNAYVVGKVIQFSLPLLAVETWRLPALSVVLERLSLRQREALKWTAVSTVSAAAISILYSVVLRDSGLAAEAPQRIAPKLDDFGVVNPASYVLLALFLSFVHSFLEEYYFRWFIFGALRRRTSLSAAYALSSMAFMAHHVIVIATYLGSEEIPLIVLLSLGVTAGGLFWAWLYERTGSLLAPWLSHVVGDLAIMGIGYDLAGPT